MATKTGQPSFFMHPESFDCTRDRKITARWQNYVTKVQRYFVITGIKEHDAKQACLLFVGGDDLSNLFETLKAKLVLIDAEEAAVNIYDATVNVFFHHRECL